MKKVYTVTVEYRGESQNKNGSSNEEPSFWEVMKKLPRIFTNLEKSIRHAIVAIICETILFIILALLQFIDAIIIVTFGAFFFSLILGPLEFISKNTLKRLTVFLIGYPISVSSYIFFYQFIEKIELLNSINVGNTLTALSLAITIFYEIYKILKEEAKNV